VGSAASVGGNMLARGLGGVANAVAPNIGEARARLIQLAEGKYGMNLRGSQVSSPMIQRMDAQATTSPLTNFGEQDAANNRQFTQMVGQTFGHAGTSITPESYTAARRAIGNEMNALQKKTPVPYDNGMQADFAAIENDAPGVLGPNELAPITYQLHNIVDKAARHNGTIPGDVYQALTQHGSALDSLISSDDPARASFGMQIRNAIDDAQERAADPADIKALQAARLRYKNAITVAPIVAKSADGSINPTLLKQRVATVFGNSALGQGDLGELGDIGKGLLTKPSSAGTAENIKAQRQWDALTGGAGIVTGLAAHNMGFPVGVDLAAAAVPMGMGMAKSAGNALLAKSIAGPGYKNILINKALNGGSPIPVNFAPKAIAYLAGQNSNRLVSGTR
jgi:phage baseplate assembly protein W